MKFLNTRKFHNKTAVEEYHVSKEEIETAESILHEAMDVLRRRNPYVADLVNHVIQQEHRTHQQNIMRNLASFMMKYRDTAGSDIHNEASVNWAKKATADGEIFFPYI